MHRCIVRKSNMYMYCQILDQEWNIVLMKSDKGLSGNTKTERALSLWKESGKILLEKGVKQVVFDRNGFPYHGRIASICDGLREAWVTV